MNKSLEKNLKNTGIPDFLNLKSTSGPQETLTSSRDPQILYRPLGPPPLQPLGGRGR